MKRRVRERVVGMNVVEDDMGSQKCDKRTVTAQHKLSVSSHGLVLGRIESNAPLPTNSGLTWLDPAIPRPFPYPFPFPLPVPPTHGH
jgi:hypothetical protein